MEEQKNVTVTSLSDFDIPPAKHRRRSRHISPEFAGVVKIVALPGLEEVDSVKDPSQYLEERTGKYIRLVETYLNTAASQGNLSMAADLLRDLLRMTTVGRAKADMTIVGLTKEMDLSKLTDEELEQFRAKVAGKDQI